MNLVVPHKDITQNNQIKRGKLVLNPSLQKPLTRDHKNLHLVLDIEINILGKLKRQGAYTGYHAL